jgi:hypothetical protein
MAVSTKISSISEASKAWRLLSGVICVYKPLGTSLTKISNDLKHKLVSGKGYGFQHGKQNVLLFHLHFHF